MQANLRRIVSGVVLLTLIMTTIWTGSTQISRAQNTPKLDVTQFQLSNGLKVILAKKDTAPTVAVNVWYEVGGADDPAGRSGFAHLFEHMMFQGSASVKKGEWDRLIEAVGGSNNAYTSIQNTGYYEVAPANQLPLLLWLEADRMGGLDINQTNLTNQRDVVIEEYRFRVSNRAYGEAQETFFSQVFDYEPYRKRVIGSPDDLNKATINEVAAFHATYYLPNNATLVVAGDIDIEQTRGMIERYFGKIAAGPTPPRLPEYKPKPRTSAERITLQDPLARTPALYLGFVAPPRSHPDYPAVEILARILGTGRSSRLAQNLVDKGLAANASTFVDDRKGPSLFGAFMVPNQNVTLDQLEKAFWEEVSKIAKEGVTKAELDKTGNQLRGDRLSSLESAFNLSESIQAANFYFGDPQAVFGELDKFRAVTSDDLKRVAAQYVQPSLQFAMLVQPGKPSDGAAALPAATAPAAAGPTLNAPARPAFAPEQKTPPAPLPVKSFKLPPVTEQTLANGLQVVIIPRSDLPLVTASLNLPGGGSAEPANAAGLAELTARTVTRGTASRSAQQIVQEVEQGGGSIGANASADRLTLSVSTLKENFPAAMTVLGDVTINAAFPASEVDTLRKAQLTDLTRTLANSQSVARRTFTSLVYGTHPYGRISTEKSISDLTRDQVAKFYQSQAIPDGAFLIIAGDITAADAMKLAESTFGSWKASGKREKITFPPTPPAAKTKIYLIDRPRSTQVDFVIGQLGLRGDSPDRFSLQVMNYILGGTFTSRLSTIVREEKGYAYSISSGYSLPVDRGYFSISTGNANNVADKALQTTLDEIKRIRTEDVPAPELSDAKNGLIGSLALSLETTNALLNQVASYKLRGIPLDDLNRIAVNLEKVDAASVKKSAQDAVNPDGLIIVAVGDAAAIREALSKIASVEDAPLK